MKDLCHVLAKGMLESAHVHVTTPSRASHRLRDFRVRNPQGHYGCMVVLRAMQQAVQEAVSCVSSWNRN